MLSRFALAFCILLGALQLTAQDLEQLLFDLPDVSFKAIDSPEGFEKTYVLKVRQPLDHKDHSKGHFYQKVYLSHRSFAAPTVMITEGYNRNRNRIYELTNFVAGNQIDIEHRFFGQSIPENLDYDYLNLEQACADYHHINQLFKKIYKEKWICTGISKGGSTTIFYRYFYPDDVEVSVPYVAPINRSFEDPRIYDFLDKVGSADCRERILDFQKNILRQREQIIPMLHWYNKGAKYTFEYFSEEQAFELAVLEYSFSFWQYGHDCTSIPDERATAETMLDHLLEISGTGFFSDDQIEYYGSHYYQSAEEMGYYGYEVEDFDDLIQAFPKGANPHAAFVPSKMKVDFDGSLLKEVNDWLDKGVDRMIYINGAIDTWSATAVPPSKKGDALWFFMEDKHHGNARIKNMTAENKAKLTDALERWLALELPIEMN